VRILLVNIGNLLAVGTGKISSYNLLKQLSVSFEATLLTYYGGPPDSDFEVQIAPLFSAVAINTRINQSTQEHVLTYQKSLQRTAVFAARKFTSVIT